jgi:hypothetical protein
MFVDLLDTILSTVLSFLVDGVLGFVTDLINLLIYGPTV